MAGCNLLTWLPPEGKLPEEEGVTAEVLDLAVFDDFFGLDDLVSELPVAMAGTEI
jgi:hypothetical protein